MPKNSLLEQKYLSELRNGSYKAFDALYDMYSQRLFAFVYKLTKSKNDAKEIVQDVFVKLWLNRENLLNNTSFQSYLFTIAKNNVINKVRTNINSPIFVDYIVYLNENKLSENNVKNLLDYDDFRFELSKAKNTLSNTQRNVFELSKELGYSNSEIASRLQLSEQTVKNQLSIALKILRKEMERFSFLFAFFFF